MDKKQLETIRNQVERLRLCSGKILAIELELLDEEDIWGELDAAVDYIDRARGVLERLLEQEDKDEVRA